MAICDVCNEEASLEAGTCYTAEEFRRVVSKGFKPEGAFWVALGAVMKDQGISERQRLENWKLQVRESTTGWFLCPGCAARAGRIIPKPAGTYAEFLDQLAPQALKDLNASQKTTSRHYLPRGRWWQFWK
jgi:hypothetical protein